MCSAQRDLCSFLSGTAVRATGVAFAAHVLETIQTPRSGLLEPAHSNSASPTQSRFSADTRCYAIRASPLAQNPSQTRRAQVPREGLCSNPLAQSPSQATRAKAPKRDLARARSHKLDIASVTLVLRPICDAMRSVRARSRKPHLRHDGCRCPRGTSLEPARTKPFTRRRPRGTLLVPARANSTSPMSPQTGM